MYALPLGGTLLECPFTIGGSGSAYIYGWCDEAFKENMTRCVRGPCRRRAPRGAFWRRRPR